MSKTSSRGRPTDPLIQQQRKQQLLAAAYELLQTKSFRTITIREIADRAGMQSAMISYYFGSKQALFMALLEQVAGQQMERIQRAAQQPEPIKAFITVTLDYFAKNSGLTRFLADEVLLQKDELGQRFLQLFPARMAAFIPRLIEQQQQAGVLRPELDPKWAAFSLMTLLVMPFVGAPVRERAWQISQQEVTSSAWADHIYQLFMAGCGLSTGKGHQHARTHTG